MLSARGVCIQSRWRRSGNPAWAQPSTVRPALVGQPPRQLEPRLADRGDYLAKRPDAKRLHLAAREFLRRVDVLPWNSAVAQHTERCGPIGSVKARYLRRFIC